MQIERHLRRSLIALLVALFAVVPASPSTGHSGRGSEQAGSQPVAGLPDLQREIERLVESAALGDATVGVSLIESERGTVLCALNDDVALLPASNMKVLTTGAALVVLGDEFTFRTRMVFDPEAERLIVIGSGDPGFGHPSLLARTRVGDRTGIDVDMLVDAWVDAVAASGIERIEEVVVDARVVDQTFVHPSWPRDQLYRSYCAPIAGFNIHANVLSFFPRPSAGQSRPVAGPSLPRADWVTVSSRGTSDPNRPSSVRIERDLRTGELELAGNVPSPMGIPIDVTLADPPAFFARLFAERLDRAGVPVTAYRVADGGDPMYGTLSQIGPAISTRLVDLLALANTDSDNMVSEGLLRRLAVADGVLPAGFLGGAAVIRRVVRDRLELVRADSRLMIADGSGLSRGNAVPASLLAEWLRSFDRDAELGPVFRSSLASAGRTGTLRRRMRDLPAGIRVQAKSGTINGVSALSGYVSDGRRTVCFSILCNDVSDTRAARRLQDRIVMRVAESLAAISGTGTD